MNILINRAAEYPKITALVLGSIYPFGFAPYYWVLPSLIAIACLYLLWQVQTAKQAALSGFIFGLTAFIVGANWILTSVGTFGGAPILLAIVLMLALHSLMGLYFAALGYLSVKYLPSVFSQKKIPNVFLTLILLASLWVLVEWLRGWVLSGFPWLNVGYLGTNNLFASFAPIGGVYFVSFSLLLISLCIALFAHPTKHIKLLGIVVIIILAAAAFLLSRIQWTTPYKQTISVALVQGGVSQDKKWLPGQLPKTMGIYHDLSIANSDVDLLVWPEAAIPNFRDQSLEFYQLIKERVGDDTGFLFSSLVEFPKKPNGSDDIRHGFYVLNDDFATPQEQVYYKQHLVPYGEYFPVPDFVAAWMLRMNLLYGDVTPGGSQQHALSWKDYKIGAFICYEDAYPNIVRSMFTQEHEANFLVNVTNDAWFSGSAAPFQHMQITQMRALEMQRPVLRATNDGVTAIIDDKGRVVSTVPQYQPEVLRGSIQPRSGKTWFALLGNWPIIGFCFILLGVYVTRFRRVKPAT